jgi:hypothetical protein
MSVMNILAIPIRAEVKRLLVCFEVDTPSNMQLCFDVSALTPHQHVLLLKQLLVTLNAKLAVLMDNYKELQKYKQLREFKKLLEELLNENRYQKVLEALFVVSYPELAEQVLQQLQVQGEEQSSSKMHM